jgi:hypothetical protein
VVVKKLPDQPFSDGKYPFISALSEGEVKKNIQKDRNAQQSSFHSSLQKEWETIA